MQKQEILETLKKVRENSRKRNFDQTVDLIINLKQLDLKKEDHKQDFFVNLPYGRGKKVKLCCLADEELRKEAESNCDKVIMHNDFSKLKKQDIKRLAEENNFFIAQANLMPEVAKIFGRILGPRGKMPNPKAGCVVPGNVNLKPLVAKLQKTIRVTTKNEPIIKVAIGIESMKDEELADNAMTVYSSLEHELPQGKNNINSILFKTTMGKPIKVGEKDEQVKGK